MTCAECRAELDAMSSLDIAAVPPAVGEHLSSCRACHSVFAALELIHGGTGLHVDPAPTLVDSVLDRVRRQGKVSKFRSLRLRVGALVAAAAVLLVVGSQVLRTVAPREQRTNLVHVQLILHAPTARSVSVVGDWNGWRPGAQPMTERDGVWEINLRLKPGADYQYQFLVNNEQWIPDPRAPMKVANGFGGENSVLAT